MTKDRKPAPKKPETKSPTRSSGSTGGDVNYGSNQFAGTTTDTTGRGDDLKFRRKSPAEIAAIRAQKALMHAYSNSAPGFGIPSLYGAASGAAMEQDAYYGGGYLDALDQQQSPTALTFSEMYDVYDDPYLRDPEGNITQWGEATRTQYEDVFKADGTLKDDATIAEGSVLYIGYGPEDMKQINLEAEASALAGGEGLNVTSLINPTDELLEALVATGRFSTLVVGSHGTEGSLYTTGADGKSRERSGKEYAAMFAGSSIQSVFVNACQGGEGAVSVADSFNKLGMSVMSWMGDVKDSRAIEVAGAFVTFTNMIATGASKRQLEAAFERFEVVGQELAFDLRSLMEEHGPDAGSILAAVQGVFGASTLGSSRADDASSYYGSSYYGSSYYGSVYDSYVGGER